MDKLVISDEGYPGTNEFLAFLEKSSHDQINALVKAVGNNCIVSGMEVSGSNLTAGWLIYNNELLPFESSVIGTTIVVVETTVSGGYDVADDGNFSTVLPIWKTRVAKFGNPGDDDVVASFAYNLLTRVNSNQNLTSLKLKAQLRLITPENAPAYVVVTGGNLTDFELVEESPGRVKIKVDFPEIVGDYHAIFQTETQNDFNYGYSNISLFSKNSTSLTFQVISNRVFSTLVEYDLRINIILIG